MSPGTQTHTVTRQDDVLVFENLPVIDLIHYFLLILFYL